MEYRKDPEEKGEALKIATGRSGGGHLFDQMNRAFFERKAGV